MKMKFIEVLLAHCCLLCLVGCSVKEDRAGCPCHLLLDMDEVDKSVVEYAAVFLTGSDGFVFKELIDSQYFTGDYCIDVPKGPVTLWVSYGAGEEGAGPHGVIVQPGEEFPCIYMHCSHIDATGDYVREPVDMVKNHCNITVCLYSGMEFPYRLEIKGNVNGYCLDGTLSEGEFCYRMELGDGGVCDVCVPRQSDDSLRLELSDDTGVIRVLALGEYISASGYDWTAKNLKDLTVSLDYSLTGMTIVVEGWDNEYHFDVVI